MDKFRCYPINLNWVGYYAVSYDNNGLKQTCNESYRVFDWGDEF
jgi:hypothetical protein